jgi:hypothetical protein
MLEGLEATMKSADANTTIVPGLERFVSAVYQALKGAGHESAEQTVPRAPNGKHIWADRQMPVGHLGTHGIKYRRPDRPQWGQTLF